MIISSQKYINNEIVADKISANDFIVTLAEIENNGVKYQIVIDGHHSLEAAKQTGNEPVFEISVYNYQSEVNSMGFDDFLAIHWVDSDWYNIETGSPVF